MNECLRKRGQLSLFVILSFIFVAGIILLSFFLGGDRSDGNKFGSASEVSDASFSFIQECLNVESRRLLVSFGEQGGVLGEPSETVFSNGSFFTLYHPDEYTAATISSLEMDFDLALYDSLFTCLHSSSVDRVFLNFSEMFVSTQIEEERVSFSLYLPTQVLLDDHTSFQDEFRVVLPSFLPPLLAGWNHVLMNFQGNSGGLSYDALLSYLEEYPSIDARLVAGGNFTLFYLAEQREGAFIPRWIRFAVSHA